MRYRKVHRKKLKPGMKVLCSGGKVVVVCSVWDRMFAYGPWIASYPKSGFVKVVDG